ncbi:hypothetical protein MGH68_17705 [Erysipelothrix sp. D19-032]
MGILKKRGILYDLTEYRNYCLCLHISFMHLFIQKNFKGNGYDVYIIVFYFGGQRIYLSGRYLYAIMSNTSHIGQKFFSKVESPLLALSDGSKINMSWKTYFWSLVKINLILCDTGRFHTFDNIKHEFITSYPHTFKFYYEYQLATLYT